MVLLAEMNRLLSKELALLNVATEYTLDSTSWATLHDYGNIVLAEAALLVFAYDRGGGGGAGGENNTRLKIGSYYVSGRAVNNSGYINVNGFVWLEAGTYDVLVEAINRSGAPTTKVKNLFVGVTNFNDIAGAALVGYTGAISKTVAVRNTCVGALAKCVFAVHVYATTPGEETNFEDVGESLTNGVSILMDSVQKNWAEKIQDNASSYVYGAGMAKARIVATVGEAHSITISKRDANTVVQLSVVACPWILPALEADAYNPVTFSFAQFSTLYVVTEPLCANPTKYCYVGKIRAVNFNAASNYYYDSSGADILLSTYAFEYVKVSVPVVLYGLGGCISNIGVDQR
jgi:hypothetical protein